MRPHYYLFFIICYVFPAYAGKTDIQIDTKKEPKSPIILIMGDSLSAGYGIDQSKDWVTLLKKRLKSNGYSYRVINASISGETSRGGLSRLPGELRQKPHIVVIELGANDGLRGLSLDSLRDNLEQMILLSQNAGAKVLLIGMRMPPNYGPQYTNGFHKIYKDLAKQFNTGLVPFLLDGVATRRDLMQADNLHPIAQAQPILLGNVWPGLLALLSK
jgi:acyl-CoA thioesterase-1